MRKGIPDRLRAVPWEGRIAVALILVIGLLAVIGRANQPDAMPTTSVPGAKTATAACLRVREQLVTMARLLDPLAPYGIGPFRSRQKAQDEAKARFDVIQSRVKAMAIPSDLAAPARLLVEAVVKATHDRTASALALLREAKSKLAHAC